MTDRTPHRKANVHGGVKAAGVLFLLLMCGYAFIQVAVRSPAAAARVGAELSLMLRQPVRISSLALSGGSLVLERLSVANPQGFPLGNIVMVRKLTITPAWSEVLLGRKAIEAVKINGLEADLRRDESGRWNFHPMMQAFQGKREVSPSETIIRRLLLENGTVKVNGRGIENLTLTADNITTMGSAVTAISLSATSQWGNVKLRGTGRPGKDPTADVWFEASSLLPGKLGENIGPLDLGNSGGSILAKGTLKKGIVSADAVFRCERAELRQRNGNIPLFADLKAEARYDVAADKMDFGRCDLQINRLVKLHGEGKAERLRSERAFTATITSRTILLDELLGQLPHSLLRDVAAAGSLLPLHLKIAGNGTQGITSVAGGLSLRDCAVSKGNKPVFAAVGADLSVSGSSGGMRLEGKVFQKERDIEYPVRHIAATLAGRFSPKLHLLQFRVPELSASLFGIPVAGTFNYEPSAPEPVAVSLNLAETPLDSFNRLTGGRVRFSAGTATGSLRASGRSPADYNGEVRFILQNAGGTAASQKFVVNNAFTDAVFAHQKGIDSLKGRAEIGGGSFAGKSAAASFSYGIDRGTLILSDGEIKGDGIDLGFTRIAGAIPKLDVAGSGKNLPLNLEISGLRCRYGDLTAQEVSGKVAAVYHTDAGRSRLKGAAEVSGVHLLLKGKDVASTSARFAFSEKGTFGDVGGVLFGGKMHARVSFDPFDRSREISFKGAVSGARGEAISALLTSEGIRIARGDVDATLSGSYSGKGGPKGSVSLRGKDFDIAGAGGKTLLAGVGFASEVSVDGTSVVIKNGMASAGKKPAVSFAGEVSRAFAAERDGAISFHLAATPLDAILDSLANTLPRSLQESTVAGTFAGRGVARIRGKEVTLDGDATLAGAGLEAPSQKLTVSGIEGTIPFSVGLSAIRHTPSTHPGRETYPLFLDMIRYGPHRGSTVTVAKIRFGALDLDDTTMIMDAAGGQISLTSFASSVAEGHLFGRGTLTIGKGVSYEGDLLIRDLSLRAFCAAYPSIKDYISGKVDGIVSFAGGAKGIGGITGFVDLWAQSSKDEKMLVSKEFLQKLAGKNLKGIFFRQDRPYDKGEISAHMENGYLTFSVLDLSNTNFFGVKDLSVSVAQEQNMISLEHLLSAVREAAARGKAVKGGAKEDVPAETEFKWQE